jgi:hypothetical protein
MIDMEKGKKLMNISLRRTTINKNPTRAQFCLAEGSSRSGPYCMARFRMNQSNHNIYKLTPRLKIFCYITTSGTCKENEAMNFLLQTTTLYQYIYPNRQMKGKGNLLQTIPEQKLETSCAGNGL